MNTKNLTVGRQVLLGLINGVEQVAEAIRPTYGPKGSNAVIEREDYPYHEVCNDAQSIVQAIHLSNPLEKRGLAILKELSDKADKDSGDGRKTTILMAQEILKAGYEADISGIQIKREIDKLLPIVLGILDDYKENIIVDEIDKVARVAGESEETGKLLKEIYQKIGKDGIIHVEGSGTYDTFYTITEGIRFTGSGYLSPYMVHDEVAQKENRKETKAIYENPTILVTKRKIQTVLDIEPLLALLKKQDKKDLIIFTDDMDSNVASLMVETHKRKIFNICIIKAPVLWKNYVFEDFAKVTGSTIVEDASGLNFKNLPVSALGTCKKIIIDKDEVIIQGGADIGDHIEQLKKEEDNDSKIRLSWLVNKTAILKLGAGSESELSYKRLKMADAIHSSRLALQYGIVLGAGVTLSQIAKQLDDSIGGKIMTRALEAPLKQLLINADIKSNEDYGKDIKDSAMVVRNAIINAVSIASTILTVSVAIHIPVKTLEQAQLEMLQAKRMPF
jgi:chaperonin GroEL